jgi:phosphatidate cytidylyltransferase
MTAVALALTIAGGWWFALLVLAAGIVMCWEWGHLVRPASDDASWLVQAGIVAAAIIATAAGYAALAGMIVIVAAVVLAIVDRDNRLAALGIVYVGLPTCGLIWLRSDAEWGLTAVMFLFIAVWGTDICAFIAGRSIGGPRLAPRISPGKTWSGLAGGVLGAVCLCLIFAFMLESAPILRLGLLGGMIALLSQAGDLAESALKRRSGKKDASHLIPGHGGLLDRVDGLIFAATFAVALAIAVNSAVPGRALVLGF